MCSRDKVGDLVSLVPQEAEDTTSQYGVKLSLIRLRTWLRWSRWPRDLVSKLFAITSVHSNMYVRVGICVHSAQ